METLNRIARSGRTVVLTIHQPRSDIVQLFDQVLILARGKTAFFGTGKEMTKYFQNLGFKCPPNYNPADFVLDLVTDMRIEAETRSGAGAEEISKQTNERIEKIIAASSSHLEQCPQIPPSDLFQQSLKGIPKYNSSWMMQFLVITWRSFLNIARDPLLTLARLIQNILMGVLSMLCFNSNFHLQKCLLPHY